MDPDRGRTWRRRCPIRPRPVGLGGLLRGLPSAPTLAVDAGIGVAPSGYRVGLIGIDVRNRNCELGPIFIGSPAHRGRGLGRDAELPVLRHCFDHLGMHKVITRVVEGNTAGLALQRSCGMGHEVVLRGQVFRGGSFIDLRLLALFADEWFARSVSR